MPNDILIALLFLFCFNRTIDAQEKLDFVSLKEDPAIVVKAGEDVTISLLFQVKKGYYVQENQIKDANLIPTALTFKTPDGIIIGEPVFPKPTKVDTTWGGPMYIYGGEIEVKVPIQVKKTTKSPHYIDAILNYQACDKSKCYFPRNLFFTIQVEVL